MATIRQTAQALAADRSTKALPVAIAQFFFIATVGTAFFRTFAAAQSSSSDNQVYINVEAHSIAFSALYFWIIPIVILGCAIGVSQTNAAIPRILRRFQAELLADSIRLPNDDLLDVELRTYHGGVYSWQPAKFQWARRTEQPVRHGRRQRWTRPSRVAPGSIDFNTKTEFVSPRERAHHSIVALITVGIGVVTSMVVSSRVPPDGWNCRHIAQLILFVVWLLSAALDPLFIFWFPLLHDESQTISDRQATRKRLFRWTLAKDILSTIVTSLNIILTQWGVLNRCDCYTSWDSTGLALPLMPDVDLILRQRLGGFYFIITVLGIGLLLVFVPAYVCWRYWEALRVYVQRDDGESNAPAWLDGMFHKKPAQRAANPSRTNTLEMGTSPPTTRLLDRPYQSLEAQEGAQSQHSPVDGDASTTSASSNAHLAQPRRRGHQPFMENRSNPLAYRSTM